MSEDSRNNLLHRCIQVQQILTGRRQIKVAELAEELGVSYSTARRWANLFSAHMDLRIENGTIFMGRKGK